MPRVRILQPVAGADRSWSEGDIVDLTPDEAAVWADGERAEMVRDERPERTTRNPIEHTARRPRRDI